MNCDQVALADKRQTQLDPEKQRLIQQQLLVENRTQPNQNVEAILARSEQVMEICQGILNGEMITPSYTVTATNNDKKKEEEKSLEPEQEKETMPVTPYMNSAALNEIAGELLITVRELREELLQVVRLSHLTSCDSGSRNRPWSLSLSVSQSHFFIINELLVTSHLYH